MATYERWELRDVTGAWAQPATGSPNPFTDPTHPIASWTSTAVYGPGFTGDAGNIFVIGSLYKNSQDVHIWRYNPTTNFWTYVTTWNESFDVKNVVAAYGYGNAGPLAGDDRPFILFATCEADGDADDRLYPFTGALTGGWLYFYYNDDDEPTFSSIDPEFSQNVYNPHLAWDGDSYIWMWGEDAEDLGEPVLFRKPTFSSAPWNQFVFDTSGVPDVDFPAVRDFCLFAFAQDEIVGGMLLLSHGYYYDEGDVFLDTTWTFNGTSWTKFTGTRPSARADIGYGSIGSAATQIDALMVGGYLDGFVATDEIWRWHDGAWDQLTDFPFGADYNMRCCGRMEDGVGLVLE